MTAPTAITFREAADTILTFGKYRGQTIDQVGASDRGLLYLDWIRGKMGAGYFAERIGVYLSDPTIAEQLAALVQRGAQS